MSGPTFDDRVIEGLARYLRTSGSEAVLSIFSAGAKWAAEVCIDAISGARQGGKLTVDQASILTTACDAIEERFGLSK